MKAAVEVPLILSLILGLTALIIFRIDFKTLAWHSMQGILLLGLLTLFIQWFWPKIRKLVYIKQTETSPVSTPPVSELSDEKLKKSRDTSQVKFEIQANSYKEQILVPREEAKKAKQEEEYYKFLGPAWKGKGEALGGNVEEADRSHTGRDDKDAAQLRQLPEEVTNPPPQPQTSKKKEKRVIVLPPEPPGEDPDALTVVLRTPIGTTHRRRFKSSSTVQLLLDYMTTVGFHQSVYTLATSYPRQVFSENTERTLEELKIHRQIILNIEEKDTEESEN